MFFIVKLGLQTRTVGLCNGLMSRLAQLRPRSLQPMRWSPLVPSGRYQPVVLPTRYLKVKPGGGRPKMVPQYVWDKVPASWSIIYESSLKHYIHSLYITVGLMGIATGVVVILRWRNLVDKLNFSDGVALGGIFLMLMCALAAGYRFAQTVVIRIYHDSGSGQFMAVRRSCLGRLKQLSYYPQDVQLLLEGRITNKDIKHSVDVTIKGQRCYLTADSFMSPVFYNAHLGSDDGPRDHIKSFVSSPRF